MKFSKGDVFKHTNGNHWKVQSGNTYEAYVYPVPKNWGLKRAKAETGKWIRPGWGDYTRIPECETSKYIAKMTAKKESKKVSKLYQWTVDEEVKFGKKIAVNEDNLWVMEEKGVGVSLVDPKDVVEVIPHSILVQAHHSKHTKHMMAEKGKFKEGEFYFVNNSDGFEVARVVKVNTKQPTTLTFKPFAKINLEILE